MRLVMYHGMWFLILGDHKMNLSLIYSLPQVVEAGTICYVIFSQATKLSSFQDLKSVWKISLGALCLDKA